MSAYLRLSTQIYGWKLKIDTICSYAYVGVRVRPHLTYLVWDKFAAWHRSKSPCYVRRKPLVRRSLIGQLLARRGRIIDVWALNNLGYSSSFPSYQEIFFFILSPLRAFPLRCLCMLAEFTVQDNPGWERPVGPTRHISSHCIAFKHKADSANPRKLWRPY